jgi:hypothetical protein
MARPDTKPLARPKPGAQTTKGEGLPFTRTNYLLFVAGLVVIVAGYISLAGGSITLAPILLVAGYCVIVPISILYRGSESSSSPQGVSGS